MVLGNERYTHFAVNFIISIRIFNKTIPIHVVYDKEPAYLLLKFYFNEDVTFSKMAKEDYISDNLFCPALAKLSLYKYSPFIKTIYFDVDGLLIKDPEPLFTECENKDFAIQIWGNYSYSESNVYDQMLWAYPHDVYNHWNIPHEHDLPATNSSFIYWNKEKGYSYLMFEVATSFLINNPMPKEKRRDSWGMSFSQPDELYWNAALAFLNYDGKLIKPLPIYFRWITQSGEPDTMEYLLENHYGIGCYGRKENNHWSVIHPVSGYYNELARAYVKEYLNQPLQFKIERLMEGKFVLEKNLVRI